MAEDRRRAAREARRRPRPAAPRAPRSAGRRRARRSRRVAVIVPPVGRRSQSSVASRAVARRARRSPTNGWASSSEEGEQRRRQPASVVRGRSAATVVAGPASPAAGRAGRGSAGAAPTSVERRRPVRPHRSAGRPGSGEPPSPAATARCAAVDERHDAAADLDGAEVAGPGRGEQVLDAGCAGGGFSSGGSAGERGERRERLSGELEVDAQAGRGQLAGVPPACSTGLARVMRIPAAARASARPPVRATRRGPDCPGLTASRRGCPRRRW